jgi:hypothetical protein
MSTEQPVWKLVANLGDVNVADYGGFLVYVDTTGVYPPEAEIYETDEQEHGGEVYRFVLDPPRFKTFKPGHYNQATLHIPSERNRSWYWYPEWFVKYLDSVASTCGTTKFQLLRGLFSKDPIKRAVAYRDIVGNFGPFEFDQYPVKLTEEEAHERYPGRIDPRPEVRS